MERHADGVDQNKFKVDQNKFKVEDKVNVNFVFYGGGAGGPAARSGGPAVKPVVEGEEVGAAHPDAARGELWRRQVREEQQNR